MDRRAYVRVGTPGDRMDHSVTRLEPRCGTRPAQAGRRALGRSRASRSGAPLSSLLAPPLRARIRGLLQLGICLLVPALAGAGLAADEVSADGSFEVPGGTLDEVVVSTRVSGSDQDMAGNPMASLVEAWPEDLVLAPIPGRSPQVGWTGTLAAAYFLDPDGTAGRGGRPSVAGGFGMYGQNGTYGLGLGTMLHLREDSVRVRLAAGYLDARYRFYGIGNDPGELDRGVKIEQEVPMLVGTASYRVWSRLFLGLGYSVGTFDTRLRVPLPELPPEFPELPEELVLGERLDFGAILVPVEYDSRDHGQFPRDGWLVEAHGRFFDEALGGDFDAQTYEVAVNRYLPVRRRDALALRAVGQSVGGDAPFFMLSAFGGSTDLRGYPFGRYRDRHMYAVQGEYRWQLSERWIVTGFAGVGGVGREVGDLLDRFLPAAGTGLRFVLSEKHRVSLSADLAVGQDGTEFYFGLGEAF